MNGYRKMMQDTGGDIGWCSPYQSEDGSIMFSVLEGFICTLLIDGQEIDSDTGLSFPEHYSEELLEKVARRMNEFYDCNTGWNNTELIIHAAEPIRNCADCPFFLECQAMDNPDIWDELPESKIYLDD